MSCTTSSNVGRRGGEAGEADKEDAAEGAGDDAEADADELCGDERGCSPSSSSSSLSAASFDSKVLYASACSC